MSQITVTGRTRKSWMTSIAPHAATLSSSSCAIARMCGRMASTRRAVKAFVSQSTQSGVVRWIAHEQAEPQKVEHRFLERSGAVQMFEEREWHPTPGASL